MTTLSFVRDFARVKEQLNSYATRKAYVWFGYQVCMVLTSWLRLIILVSCLCPIGITCIFDHPNNIRVGIRTAPVFGL